MFKNILKYLKFFFKVKFEYKLLYETKILFLNSRNVDLFKKHIYNEELNVIDLPHCVNLRILIKSFFKKKTSGFLQNYIIHYIDIYNPNLVTSCTDQEWLDKLDKINNNDPILYDFGNTKLKNLINKSI